MVKNKNRIKKTTPEEEKVCWGCGGIAEELIKYLPEGISYNYWKCTKCGDEVLSMRQLEVLAKKEREFRHTKEVTISRWGTAVALRIPQEIIKEEKIRVGEKVRIIKERVGFRVIPERISIQARNVHKK